MTKSVSKLVCVFGVFYLCASVFSGSSDRDELKENGFHSAVRHQSIIQRPLSLYAALHSLGQCENTIICKYLLFFLLNPELPFNVFAAELPGNCHSKCCSVQNISTNCLLVAA